MLNLMCYIRVGVVLFLLAGLMPTPLSAQLSSSYSFKQGHGRVPWLMVYDHGDYVARDFNGDNTLDVMGLPSTHGSHKVLNEVSWHRGIAFLSAGDGSYRFVRTGSRINNTATELQIATIFHVCGHCSTSQHSRACPERSSAASNQGQARR